MEKKLQQAIVLSKKGEKEQAGILLRELVNEDPQNLTAWFWLADAMQTDQERVEVLQEAVSNHPEDKRLAGALARLLNTGVELKKDDEVVSADFSNDNQVVSYDEFDRQLDESLVDEFDPGIFEDEEPQQAEKPVQKAKKSSGYTHFLLIIFVLLIATLAVAWLFRDSLVTFLPSNDQPVAIVPSETMAIVENSATPNQEPTQTDTPVPTATEPLPTETAAASSPGGTATPILLTTPTNTAVVEEGKFITVSGSQINDITWSLDGDYFAVASDAGITIFNGETFAAKIEITLDPVIPVLAITFSPDNKYIAAGFDQANSGEELITRAKMWQVNDGAEVMSFDYNAPRGDIDTLAFSSDGETLLLNAKLDVVLKWRVDDGSLLDVFTLSASEVDYFGVSFSPDRLSFATYSKFDRVRIFDTLFGEQTAILGEEKDINDVAFSANSQYLAVMFEEQPFVYLWDLPSKTKIKEWNTFDGNVTTLAFDADNQTLAVATDEDLIKFYQIRTGEEQRVISRQIPEVIEMEFAPDDILFAVRNQTEIQIWHLLTDTLVATFRVLD